MSQYTYLKKKNDERFQIVQRNVGGLMNYSIDTLKNTKRKILAVCPCLLSCQPKQHVTYN